MCILQVYIYIMRFMGFTYNQTEVLFYHIEIRFLSYLINFNDLIKKYTKVKLHLHQM